jgi:nucleotide-binding universal stress UspA family protein
MKHWNDLTHDEQVAKLPDLINVLAEGHGTGYREVLTERLAEIAKQPDGLLNLMKPGRGQQTPPRLQSLIDYANNESLARAELASGGLAALAAERGITDDRILSRRTDAPGIVIQLGSNEKNQASITRQNGQWTVSVSGPAFATDDTLHVESDEEALHVVGKMLEIYEDELNAPAPAPEGSEALAALAEKHGIPASQIVGKGTDDDAIVVRLDDADTNRAMLNQNDVGEWDLHIGGDKFGPDGATLSFDSAEQAVAALADIMVSMFSGTAPQSVH